MAPLQGLLLSAILLATAARAADGNDVIAQCADGETTHAKDKCKRANQGKTFDFEGEVHDVRSEKVLRVKLSSGNYADVEFKRKIAELVDKGQFIRFTGKLTRVGTGILVSHDITKAVLK